MQAAQARMAAFTQGAPAAESPASGMPVAGPGGAPQMPANAQEMMAANAKRALESTKDPNMRKMLIAQLRAAGIDVDEESG